MSRTRFTEADVKRAVKGVIDGGGMVASVEIRPDGSILVKAATRPAPLNDQEETSESLRRLL